MLELFVCCVVCARVFVFVLLNNYIVFAVLFYLYLLCLFVYVMGSSPRACVFFVCV